MVYSKDQFTQAPGVRPVVGTKQTLDQLLYEVVVKTAQGQTETYTTTSEHPFWVTNGPANGQWLKASLVTSTTESGLKRTTVTPRSKDPDVKQITIIEGQNNSKAVIVDYKDPVTGDLARANVPYDNRGLPIMDNVAASTQKIDYTKSYDGQMIQATKDLRNEIKNDKN